MVNASNSLEKESSFAIKDIRYPCWLLWESSLIATKYLLITQIVGYKRYMRGI